MTNPTEHNPEPLRYWLALNRTPGVGTVTLHDLLERYGEPAGIVDDPDAPDPRAPKMTWVH